MKNAHDTTKRFVLTRFTKNVLGQKISHRTKFAIRARPSIFGPKILGVEVFNLKT